MLGNFGGLCRILKTNLFSHHLYKVQPHSEFGLLALSGISPKRLERIFLKSLLKLSLRLIHCKTLKFQDKPILRTGQKSALQHSLF